MTRSGPDGAASWLIACACCFINMMMYGMARLSGMLFVASVPRYHVTREGASFPYTVANFVRNTSGPLVGYLGHRLGVRPVATVGCLFAAIGVGACFLAEQIEMIIGFWGIIFGLGFGLGNILLPISINQYFDKKRATASGISFSGACLGSFILPSVVEILLDTYGLSGTFLILSGIVLHCVPAALLLKKPTFQRQVCRTEEKDDLFEEKTSIISGKRIKLYTTEDDSSSSLPKVRSFGALHTETQPDAVLTYEEKIKGLSTQTLLSNYSIRMSSPDPLNLEQILENSKGRRQVDQDALDNSSLTSYQSDRDSLYDKEISTDPSRNCESIKNGFSKHAHRSTRASSDETNASFAKANLAFTHSKSFTDLYINNAYSNDSTFRTKGNPELEKSTNGRQAHAKDHNSTLAAFSVIWDPIFLLITLTNAFYCFSFVCMFTVLVDFSRDIGIGQSNEKYVLMSLSVGDLIGRLGLGWVTDDGHMSRTNFSALCFFCQGMAIAAIALSTNFLILVILSFLYGLSEAGLIVVYPLIVAEFIDEDKQIVAIPSTNFLAGPLCLTVAPLIGYFRDEVGSYEFIFFGMGVVSVICCIAWLLTPCILRCRKLSKNR